MNKILNVKVDTRVKLKAKQKAEELGLSLSGVVNAYLRQFIRTGTFFVSTEFEEPSEYLKKAISEAEEDRKNKKHYSFDNAKDAIDFLDKIIARKK